MKGVWWQKALSEELVDYQYDLVYLHGYEIKLTSKRKISKDLQCISPIVFVKLVFLPFSIQVC